MALALPLVGANAVALANRVAARMSFIVIKLSVGLKCENKCSLLLANHLRIAGLTSHFTL